MDDILEKSRKEMEEALGVKLRRIGQPRSDSIFVVGHPTRAQIIEFVKNLDSKSGMEVGFFLNHIVGCNGDCAKVFNDEKSKKEKPLE